MLIGIISDSHDCVPVIIKAIHLLINNDVDEIIHLGDIISPFIPRFIKKELEKRDVSTKLLSILGNNDGDIYMLSKLFSEYNWRLLSSPSIVEYEGRSFYLMHGYGSADFTEKLAKTIFEKIDTDVVLFGHTHRLLINRVDNRVLLNPGEVCGYLTGRSTVVILDTRDLSTRVFDLY